MYILSSILIIIGGLVSFSGLLWMFFEAFRSHILWGISSVLLPGAILVWLGYNWKEGWKPFSLFIGGFTLAVGSFWWLG